MSEEHSPNKHIESGEEGDIIGKHLNSGEVSETAEKGIQEPHKQDEEEDCASKFVYPFDQSDIPAPSTPRSQDDNMKDGHFNDLVE
jgi:hypothetical protein